MWKRQEESPTQPAGTPNPTNTSKEASPVSTLPQFPERRIEQETSRASSVAHIGKSVRIKGELSGSEDLHIDGQVEGTIELRDYHLTVGSSGKVQANINAKRVVIHGSVRGNIHAT